MTDQGKYRIYVLFYKTGTVVKNDSLYKPLMAGNALLTEKSDISGDDSGENISDKNLNYSELTALYWIWKNAQHDVIGACHYRRFFTLRPEPFLYKLKRLLYYPAGLYRKRHGLIYTKSIGYWRNKLLTVDNINLLLSQYDAVLPQARRLKYSVEKHYTRYHNTTDLKLVESILLEKYPEFITAFHEILRGNRMYANNMFILKNNHFQELMGWLFDILFEFERRVELSKYDGYQQRVMGFIAERLITVWFCKKKLNVAELPVVYFKKLKYD